ncbi:UNVERIFIED_CONTAM: tRNA pseudouridine synthase B, putative [Hammondia hammondi]|eukprot:XP_008884901.1 tRNA pseudouridine synthase B, putative [Hammondia hammondi]
MCSLLCCLVCLVFSLCLKELINKSRPICSVSAASEWRLAAGTLLTVPALSAYPCFVQSLPLACNGGFPLRATLCVLNSHFGETKNFPAHCDKYRWESLTGSAASAHLSLFFPTETPGRNKPTYEVRKPRVGFCSPPFAPCDKSRMQCVGPISNSICSRACRKAGAVGPARRSVFEELRKGKSCSSAWCFRAKERPGTLPAPASISESNNKSIAGWAHRLPHNGGKLGSTTQTLWAFNAGNAEVYKQRSGAAGGLVGVVKPKGITSMDVCRGVSELLKSHRHSRDRTLASPGVDETEDLLPGVLHSRGEVGEMQTRTGRRKTGVGHGGTLDPAATGVLILGIGEGTKRLRHFLTGWKRYKAVVRLGVTTDTLDSEGRVVAEEEWRHVTLATLKRVLPSFLGKQLQQPPLFSAKRVKGVRMYDIARSIQEQQDRRSQNSFPLGDAVHAGNNHEAFVNHSEARRSVAAPFEMRQQLPERLQKPPSVGGGNSALHQAVTKHVSLPNPCEIEISELELVDEEEFEMPHFAISVTCSKGTYIRQLAADIAARCGTVGHLTELTRTFQAPFRLEDCVNFEDLTADGLLRHLIPVHVIDRILREKKRQ